MNSQRDAEEFINKFQEFSKINNTNLFFSLYKSKVERISNTSYFKKYNFIKTILSGLVAWFLIFFLIYFIHRQNTPDDVDMVEFPGWIALIISILVYSLAPVLWLLTFIQLKTKQV